jgi:hypothetical protein
MGVLKRNGSNPCIQKSFFKMGCLIKVDPAGRNRNRDPVTGKNLSFWGG